MTLVLAGCEGDSSCRQDLRVRAGITIARDTLVQVEVVDTTTHDTTWVWQHQLLDHTYGMQVHGLGKDSLLADSIVSSFLLPLRKDRDSTAMVMHYAGVNDTVVVVYEREEKYVSLACGCSVFATLKELRGTGHMVDSVAIVNSAVTNIKENHLILFIHTPKK